MPELHFKGKEFVFNHHLTVPHRPIVPGPEKSVGDWDGHGQPDHPRRQPARAEGPAARCTQGRVDCIYIDPPYNTGNENWIYNDNVNCPMMREWLDGNPVNKDDMLRHDKWLCMMYPRLKLLQGAAGRDRQHLDDA